MDDVGAIGSEVVGYAPVFGAPPAPSKTPRFRNLLFSNENRKPGSAREARFDLFAKSSFLEHVERKQYDGPTELTRRRFGVALRANGARGPDVTSHRDRVDSAPNPGRRTGGSEFRLSGGRGSGSRCLVPTDRVHAEPNSGRRTSRSPLSGGQGPGIGLDVPPDRVHAAPNSGRRTGGSEFRLSGGRGSGSRCLVPTDRVHAEPNSGRRTSRSPLSGGQGPGSGRDVPPDRVDAAPTSGRRTGGSEFRLSGGRDGTLDPARVSGRKGMVRRNAMTPRLPNR